jgi:hypothetical protein
MYDKKAFPKVLPTCFCGNSMLFLEANARGKVYACNVCGRICIENDCQLDEIRGAVYQDEALPG